MRMLKPLGDHIGERIVYVDSPTSKAEIDRLTSQLSEIQARPTRVIEKIVEKIVEKVVPDKDILEKLNASLREIAELKSRKHSPFQTQQKTLEIQVEKVVKVPIVTFVYDKVSLVALFFVGSIVGFFIGRIH